MTTRLPRGLAGRPRVALAPSRILQATCTTRYGEAPGDDDVASLVEARFGSCPLVLPWFPAAHRDQPEGTVWKVFVCPARDPRSGRNLPSGSEPGPESSPPCELVLPMALWAARLLESGIQSSRSTRSPDGLWVSQWADGMLETLDGPFQDDSLLLGSGTDRTRFEEIPWRDPIQDDLLELAEEHPQAQMLSEAVSTTRSERLANWTALRRCLVVLALGLVVGIVSRTPVWWAASRLSSTENRLAEVRPELDRLERIRRQAFLDAAFLDSSYAAFRPSASAKPLLAGIASRLPAGVRLRAIQLDSPPGETAWQLRIEARLDDWRSVGVLVDSLRNVPGVSEVRVETQQREQEKVHLAVSMQGDWP